jgi:hypothetical protein
MHRFTMAALLALPLMVHAGDGMNEVRQQLQVDSAGGKVVVRIAVENGGAKPVFVPKAVFKSDRIFRREFAVTDAATGAEVGYTGPMVKRGPLTKDDFMAVKPGQKHSHSIDITHSYAFLPKHSYRLSYEGAYLGDAGKPEASSAVTVPAVTFTVN